MERLDFQMPDFLRVSWVNDHARSVWEPRFLQIAEAWLDIQWLSVIAGLRHCCRINTTTQYLAARADRWTEQGLEVMPLGIELPPTPSGPSLPANQQQSLVIQLLIGKGHDIASFHSAYSAHDCRMMGDLLGYPPCCISFVSEVVHKQGFIDTTWHTALTTLPEADATRELEVTGNLEANTLWRRLGLCAVPHLPCSFACSPTSELGQKLLDVGREAGYVKETEWLQEILSWPWQWSALHGIAELKTPILRMITRADATGRKYVIRRKGSGYPNESGHGLTFPYMAPRSPLLTLSRGFKRGLQTPISGSD